MHRLAAAAFVLLGAGLVFAGIAPRIATTPADFVQPGTQPSPAEFDDFLASTPLCASCHAGYAATNFEPYDSWVASMMAQAARDPVTRAAAAIANADAAGAGETCIRCHAPIGWLQGRSASGQFSALQAIDLDGVTCHVCHRMVDPIARVDAPALDADILAVLDGAGTRPRGTCAGAPAQPCSSDAECGTPRPCEIQAGQGRFVIDPDDHRRGPRSIAFHLHPTTASSFFTRAEVCAPCHDVSTPTFTRDPDGTYVLNALDAPHPTQDPNQMFPEQRTFSEWRASAFPAGVVFPDGRFGGTKTAMLPNTVPVETCQDCHMPTVDVAPCVTASPRADVGGHFFAGANTWVLGAILDEYGAPSGLNAGNVAAAAARTAAMLRGAADLSVAQAGSSVTVRVTNQTGHKLPTGYPEGRRMWLRLQAFTGEDPIPLSVDGAYDDATATLDVAGTTKIYETKQEIDAAVGAAAGLPAGTPFHLVLNSRVAFDNRIPPRGFTQAAFAGFGGAPVGAAYADGQHWDETVYRVPAATTRVEVTLFYQTTTREYAEFLRDTTPDATGQNAYDRWVARGRSAPVAMAQATLDLVPICEPDARPCEDGDPCSVGDGCAAGVCASGPLELACVLDELTTPGICADPLPRKLARAVARAARGVRARTERALRKRAKGAAAAKVGRLFDKAAALLETLATRIDGAATTQKAAQHIPAECATTLGARVARATAAIDVLRAEPRLRLGSGSNARVSRR